MIFSLLTAQRLGDDSFQLVTGRGRIVCTLSGMDEKDADWIAAAANAAILRECRRLQKEGVTERCKDTMELFEAAP